MYVSPVLSYAEKSWMSFVSSSVWKNLETVQTIDLKTISGSPYFVKSKVILNSINMKSVQKPSMVKKKTFFYTESISKYDHIMVIGC